MLPHIFCSCRRSGCLKNNCACYEKACGSNCICLGYRNIVDRVSTNLDRFCSCRRSGCLKNNCSCYEKACGSNCICLGYRNIVDRVSTNLDRFCSCRRSGCLKNNCACYEKACGSNCICLGYRNIVDRVSTNLDRFCSCRRSGCLKNNCACYEAKKACGSNCICLGCRNIVDRVSTNLDRNGLPKIVGSSLANNPNAVTESVATTTMDKSVQCNLITGELIDAAVQCMITQAAECEKNKLSAYQTEEIVLEEWEIIEVLKPDAENNH